MSLPNETYMSHNVESDLTVSMFALSYSYCQIFSAITVFLPLNYMNTISSFATLTAVSLLHFITSHVLAKTQRLTSKSHKIVFTRVNINSNFSTLCCPIISVKVEINFQ